jgi:hypothetical protein
MAKKKRSKTKATASNEKRISSIIVGLTITVITSAIFLLVYSDPLKLYLEKSVVNSISNNTSLNNQPLKPAPQVISQTFDLYNTVSTANQPSYISNVPSTIKTTDARAIAMYNFLLDYNSPMYPNAETFIEEADKYGLDWRLVASISGVESAFGRLIAPNSFNGWGWKGDPTQEWSHFDDWDHGITVVTERMALGYGIKLTPYQIEATYCPPCGANPAHAWANGVQGYMNALNIYLDEVEAE